MSDEFQHPTDPRDPVYVDPYVREAVIVDNRAAVAGHAVGLGLSAVTIGVLIIILYFSLA
jgi:hypothetical protein